MAFPGSTALLTSSSGSLASWQKIFGRIIIETLCMNAKGAGWKNWMSVRSAQNLNW